VRGALSTGNLTLAELREAALHTAVYAGWSYGDVVDAAVTKVPQRWPGAADYAPIRAAHWDRRYVTRKQRQLQTQHALWRTATQTAYFEGGILNFVFGEMWNGQRSISEHAVADPCRGWQQFFEHANTQPRLVGDGERQRVTRGDVRIRAAICHPCRLPRAS